jgi:thiosulfate reductase cytochrome b subunit
MNDRIYRYGFVIRLAHWTNLLCLVILLMSGLQIFNAHPALYWGEASDFEHPLLSISTDSTSDGQLIGVTTVTGRRFETDGMLGRSDLDGQAVQRAFPGWLTIPSVRDLATGRVWHFFFAWLFLVNGVIYAVHSFMNGHVARDLAPARGEWRQIGATIRDHLTLRFPRGPSAARYNVLQRLTYLGVVFVLAPLVIVTGLTMSPAVNAAMPWLLDVFGGRQSARTGHFIIALWFVSFVAVHVLLVALSGFFNNIRSMITGWFAIR